MTVPDVDARTCPACGHPSTLELSDGTRLCLDCRHEYDPAVEHWTAPAPVAVVVDPVDAILGPPADVVPNAVDRWKAEDDAREALAPDLADEVAAAEFLDGLIGARVELDGGQIVTVTELVDDDWIKVRTNDGREEAVNFGDVVRQLPAVVAPADDPGDVPDEVVPIVTAVAGMVDAVSRLTSLCQVDPLVLAETIDAYRLDELGDPAELLPLAIGDVVAAAQGLAVALRLPANLVADFVAAETGNGNTPTEGEPE